jgi:hypothetical protein
VEGVPPGKLQLQEVGLFVEESLKLTVLEAHITLGEIAPNATPGAITLDVPLISMSSRYRLFP